MESKYRYIYPDCTHNLDGYNKLHNKYKQIVNYYLFPNLVNITLRYQLRLVNYQLWELNVIQLIFELQQRDIQIFDSKSTELKIMCKINMIQRLKSFLDDYECRKKDEILVHGYCKQYNNN